MIRWECSHAVLTWSLQRHTHKLIHTLKTEQLPHTVAGRLKAKWKALSYHGNSNIRNRRSQGFLKHIDQPSPILKKKKGNTDCQHAWPTVCQVTISLLLKLQTPDVATSFHPGQQVPAEKAYPPTQCYHHDDMHN